ncbi:MAG: sugar O-acyltransferase, partial [Ignavibacteria bacterium]|nr:sugar O-acyltransferase [Ignavibacteria bacterium]
MKTKKLIIIGNTSNARLAKYFFETDSEFAVKAFSVNKEYITESEFVDLPVTPFEEIKKNYPPEEFELFVAVGYTN